jgi:hypothetical protein
LGLLALVILIGIVLAITLSMSSASPLSDVDHNPAEYGTTQSIGVKTVGHDEPSLVPPPPQVNPALIVSLLPQDSIQAIDEPEFQTAEVASHAMDPDERVIGLVINGDARAYPIPVLSVHEIVNDEVGGEPVAITWCPLCYTALVFSRNSENRNDPLSFGVSGKLLYETLVMYDRETDSLWSQLYGVAIEGPMSGTRLSFFPSVFTEWSAWIEQHPDTLVMDKEATCKRFRCGTYSSNPRGSYDVDPYASYYIRPGQGVVNHQIPRDDELALDAPKKRVLGIRIAGQARAYPYDSLVNQPLINDTVNGLPVLIWFEASTQTGSAFLRTVDRAELTFSTDPLDPGILLDNETGSRWQASSGEAISGPFKGSRLEPVFMTSAFEFGWFDYFPDSETYGVK